MDERHRPQPDPTDVGGQYHPGEIVRRREVLVRPATHELRPRPALLYGSDASKRSERTRDMPPANRTARSTDHASRRHAGLIRPENSRREAVLALVDPGAETRQADIDRSIRQTLSESERADPLHREQNLRDARLPQTVERAADDPRRAMGQRVGDADSTLHPTHPTNADHHGAHANRVPEPLVAAPVRAARPLKNPELVGMTPAQDRARRVERGRAPVLRAPRYGTPVVPADRHAAQATTAVHVGTRVPGQVQKQPRRRETPEPEGRRRLDTTRVNVGAPRTNPTRRMKKERAPLERKETDRSGEVHAPVTQPAIQRRQRRERAPNTRLVRQSPVFLPDAYVEARGDRRRPPRDRARVVQHRPEQWNLNTRPLAAAPDRAPAPENGDQQAYRKRHGVTQRQFLA